MSQQQQQRRVLAKAATCGWRDCLLWRRARASTACAGLPCLLSPPAGSAQPCLLRAQRARRAPPSELLQRVKQKAAAAAASPESSTRCCRPARTCTYSLVSGFTAFSCFHLHTHFTCTFLCTCTHCDYNGHQQNIELEKYALERIGAVPGDGMAQMGLICLFFGPWTKVAATLISLFGPSQDPWGLKEQRTKN